MCQKVQKSETECNKANVNRNAGEVEVFEEDQEGKVPTNLIWRDEIKVMSSFSGRHDLNSRVWVVN